MELTWWRHLLRPPSLAAFVISIFNGAAALFYYESYYEIVISPVDPERRTQRRTKS